MSRLETALRARLERGGKALVPFLAGGYPDLDTFRVLLHAAEEAGADAVEVGIPFSDPVADGPVIQAASARALAGGATPDRLFETVARARAGGLETPVVFMTYYNPVLAYGPARFAERAAAAGADGVLVVDLPPEEADEFLPAARNAGLDTVFLVAPTTPEGRVRRVVEACRGFVYCVSVTGVTGQKRPVVETVRDLVARVRRHTGLAALVGFGVSDPASARRVAAVSDGVVVGSALIRALEGREGREARAAALGFLGPMRKALG